jgi:hypothetical protein
MNIRYSIKQKSPLRLLGTGFVFYSENHFSAFSSFFVGIFIRTMQAVKRMSSQKSCD